ncbi:MAG: hypothetical protein GF317_08630 [Candidatus Lokiarchaeota archaeon]|nr:hypothetical protein [Candidatus Lokiarchaeota archaeon]MBD3199780.1 hypothetical protein [Candidatus Lokiarchaeota archaeon]
MNANNPYVVNGPRRKKRTLISLVILITFIFSVLSANILSINSIYNKDENSTKNEFFFPDNQEDISISGLDPSILQDPYTTNFTSITDFFNFNYKSDFEYEITTYYRKGDASGTITEDIIYSLDNLLIYNTLLKNQLNSTEIIDKYSLLKSTPLWYEGAGIYDYGFVESIENSTGEIETQRNLIDNLVPIFLLSENMPSVQNADFVGNITEVFNLINSTQYWNSTLKVFNNYNSSKCSIYTESNLYAILGNLLIYQNSAFPSEIRNRALYLANQTLITLTKNLWDVDDYGYYYNMSRDLTPDTSENKKLEINALGIVTLLKFWEATGMDESIYLTNATLLFNKIEGFIWDSTNNLYQKEANNDWSVSDSTLDLKVNSLMLTATLGLFEFSGNESYYNRVIELFESIESKLFDTNVNAYTKTISDNNKDLLYNLKTADAYLNAFAIYNQTYLEVAFNSSDIVPEYIFDQDSLTLMVNYTFQSYNYKYYIPNASLSFILRYPNGTIIETKNNITNVNGSYSFQYFISNALPITDGYSIDIVANTTYFSWAKTKEYFNIISGVDIVNGLDTIDSYYQGERVNLTLVVNNTRLNDLVLNASIESININFNQKEIDVNSSISNDIWLNFTVKNDALPGIYQFNFVFSLGNIIYLDLNISVEIQNALQYSNLIYDGKVVEADILEIAITVSNFLPNESQSFNISFLGDHIQNYKEQIALGQNEIKYLTYDLSIIDVIPADSIQVEMKITKAQSEFYSETMSIEVVDKFEIITYYFPDKVSQGAPATFILNVKNNKKSSEGFSLYINGEKKSTNLNVLNPGENRVEETLVPSINPYDFSTKYYIVVVKDIDGNEIFSFIFDTDIELSTMNLVLFYILPIAVPIAIVLFYKNKEMKMKLLRR